MIALAVVAAAWFAYGLHVLSLAGQGRADARVAHTPEQVARTLSLFRKAARANPDPTPKIDEGAFLLSHGRPRQAIAVLNGVVRSNSGNTVAYFELAAASAGLDPLREAEANPQLFALFGHPNILYPATSALFPPTGGHVHLAPGRVQGHLDSLTIQGGTARFDGWSATVGTTSGHPSAVPAEEVLVLLNGRFVAGATPTLSRPDVARSLHVATAPLGFTLDVPLRELKSAGAPGKVQVFGVAGPLASQLPVTCRPHPQALVCR